MVLPPPQALSGQIRRIASIKIEFKLIFLSVTLKWSILLYIMLIRIWNLTPIFVQGSYIHIPHDHIAYRYEILKVIGKGSFGQVLKVYDHKTHQHVALKMVRNEKRFHRQAQEEIRILEHLRKQDKDNSCNIIHMLDNFTFR